MFLGQNTGSFYGNDGSWVIEWTEQKGPGAEGRAAWVNFDAVAKCRKKGMLAS